MIILKILFVLSKYNYNVIDLLSLKGHRME